MKEEKRRFKKRYLLAISLLILGGVIYASDPATILATLCGIRPVYWLILPIPFMVTTFLRVYRWKLLLSSTKELSFFSLLPIQLAGLAISNITPGRVGEPAKALFLKKREDIPVSKSLLSIVWERLLDLVFLVIFTVPFILSFIGQFNPNLVSLGRSALGLVALLIIFTILLIRNERIGLRIAKVSEKIPLIKRHLTQDFMLSFYGSTRIKSSTLISCAIMTMIIWIFEAAAFYIAFSAIGISEFSLWFLATLLAFAIICGVVSFLPGGIGSTEGILILVLGISGISASSAASGVLIARFFTLWFAIGFGFLSLSLLGKNKTDQCQTILKT